MRLPLACLLGRVHTDYLNTQKIVKEEIKAMLEMGVIEESHSAWASPIVLMNKPNGAIRFCVDYRKVNSVNKLLGQLGTAKFFLTLDLQSPRGNRPPPLRMAYIRLKLLFGGPATLEGLMDQVLRPHTEYAAAYLDDVIIHSDTWQQHLLRVAADLESLRQAELTANPKKCVIGRREAWYPGNHFGRRAGAFAVKRTH